MAEHGAERVGLPEVVAEQQRQNRAARQGIEKTPGPSARLPKRALPPGSGSPARASS